MTADAADLNARPARPPREIIYRHTFIVRLTHWINALVIFVMVGTGLNIFNAHPRLYWGQQGANFDPAWLSIGVEPVRNVARGVLHLGGLRFDTTCVLGLSHGAGRAWPDWATLPSRTDLADARRWHFTFAWILVVNGLLYLSWSLLIRHLQRDLVPTVSDLRAVPRSIADHARLKHPTGEEAKRYNVLQRLAYLGLIALVILMVLTGLAMSPGMDAFAPGLLDAFGGRQSARSIHFICAALVVAFIVVHLVEVVLAGPLNEVWSMISGRYRVPRPRAGRVSGEERGA